MTYTQIPYTSFGGLLISPEAESEPGNHAVDGLNFELGDGHQIRVRDQVRGFMTCGSPASPPFGFGSLFDPVTQKQYTMVGQRTGLQVSLYAETGAGLGPAFVTTVVPTGNPEKIIPFGTPNSAAVLLLPNLASGAVQKWVLPSTLTSPTVTMIDPITGAATVGGSMPRCFTGAYWGQQGRTVYGGFPSSTGFGPNGLVSSQDHLWFSEPGDPTKFRNDAFVVVGAGDGEYITSVETIGDYVIVFKETKFYVFYGVSSSARGVPIFNYRVGDYGLGCLWRNGSCRGRDGIYFVAQDGVYVTKGDIPRKLSSAIDGLFTGTSSQLYTGKKIAGPISQQFVRIVSVDDRVYISCVIDDPVAGLTPRTIVGDLKHGWWSIWRTGGTTGSVAHIGKFRDWQGAYHVLHPIQSGGNWYWGPAEEGRVNQEAIADAFYQSAFVDVADDSKARVRQVEVWGSGTPTIRLRSDFRSAVGGEGQVNLNTNGAAMMRKAVVGERISTEISNAGNTSDKVGFKVSRYVHHVSNKRVPSAL